jgi:signal transduction histidine kinase
LALYVRQLIPSNGWNVISMHHPHKLLFVGFGGVILVMAVIVGLAVHSMQTIGERYELATSRDLNVVFSLERLHAAGLHLNASSNEVALLASTGLSDEEEEIDDDASADAHNTERNEIEEAIENLSDSLTKFKKDAGHLDQNGAPIVDPSLLAEVETHVASFIEAGMHMVAVASVQMPSAVELFEAKEELEEVEKVFLETIGKLLDDRAQKFETGRLETKDLIGGRLNLLLLGTLLAGVIALGTALISGRGILVILGKLAGTNAQLSELNTALGIQMEQKEAAKQALAETNTSLKQRTEELIAAQEDLLRQDRLATLGRLTATVSHEIRNPLGAVRSSLYLVKQKTESSGLGIERALDRAERGVLRCDNIISELLDFARETEPKLESTSIDQWLKEVLAELATPEDVEIHLDLHADGARLLCDRERMRRAVVNMFENACHAMADNPPDQTRRFRATSNVIGESVVLEFTDNGAGMDEETLSRVFEPLYSTKSFGVGLGLPIVKKIIESHDGTLEYRSESGKGTTACITLPLEVEQEAAA